MRRFTRGVLLSLLLVAMAGFPSSLLAGDPILIPPPKEIYFVDGEGQLVYYAFNLKEGDIFGGPIIQGDFTDGSSTALFLGIPMQPESMLWAALLQPTISGEIVRFGDDYYWNDSLGNFGYLVFP